MEQLAGADQNQLKRGPTTFTFYRPLRIPKEAVINKNLRNLIHQHQESKGIKVGKMSEMLGYRNISKVFNKILWFEREGLASNELIQKLIDVLGVEPLEVQRALQKDYQDWQAWLDEPVVRQAKLGISYRVEVPVG